ncbi:interleukin-15-like isoform X2 [Brienomyrus brachyistius]|uniref:interleukin-15-like isoform X2 n=1 Tax=Brienomyrus brachyistius TaxID=42636 RepID=UPI0020B31719|nr:interleukin-15-like isoform X2 [Brienomyrus brachyistius]
MSAFLTSALLIHCFFILMKLCTLRDCSVKKSVRHGGFFLPHCQCFKGDVWIKYCILSCLCECLGNTEAPDFKEINKRLNKQRDAFQETRIFVPNGMYYAPDSNYNCTWHEMLCYVLELEVIMNEANVSIDTFWEDLKNHSSEKATNSGCPQCEEYQETNTEMFLHKFDRFLQIIQSQS